MVSRSIKNSIWAISLHLFFASTITLGLFFMLRCIVIYETHSHADNIIPTPIIPPDFCIRFLILITSWAVVRLLIFKRWPPSKSLRTKLQSLFRLYKTSYIITLSIFFTLSSIGLLYPIVPSITSYRNSVDRFLISNVQMVWPDVDAAIKAGDLNYLNDNFIKSEYTVGHMHFKIIPSDNLKKEILSASDYRPTVLLGHKMEGSNVWDINGKETNDTLLSQSSSVYWDYTDAETINKAHSVNFVVDINSVKRCYDFYYQTSSSGIFSDLKNTGKICMFNGKTFKVPISYTPGDTKINSIRFWVEPEKTTDQDVPGVWEVGDAKVFTDTSDKDNLNFCLEAVHDGAKDMYVHTDASGYPPADGPCPEHVK